KCTLAQVPVHGVAFRRFRRTINPFVLAGQIYAIHRTSQQICALCREKRFHILHANTDTAAVVAWETSRITGIPFVWHCRDIRPMHGFARVLSGAASAVVAISDAVEKHLLKEGVKLEKIKRINNGIDLSRMSASEDRVVTYLQYNEGRRDACDTHVAARLRARAKLGIADTRAVILSVGAFVPWKKHELFIETIDRLRQRIPTILGLLVGSDKMNENRDYEDALCNFATDLGLLKSDTLRLLGERDDVPELMAAADLLISCSENEPFGRVLAEAGAAGLPVVSTRSGGKTEIVVDEVTGVLTRQDDTPALVEACTRLLNDANQRQTLGEQARKRVETLYDVRRTANELAALFKMIAMSKN
ncbi:MAG: glycosyltransferase family 4 protein, partial [Planctomycetota bacterium]